MKRHFIYARAWPGWLHTFDLSPFLALDDDRVAWALDELARRWDADHPGRVEELREVRARQVELIAQSKKPAIGDEARDHRERLRLAAPHLLDDVAVLAGWAIYPPGPYCISPGRSVFHPSGFQLFHGCENQATADTVVGVLRSRHAHLRDVDSFFGASAIVQFELSGRSSKVDRARQARSLIERQAEGILSSGWLGVLAEHARQCEETLVGTSAKKGVPASSRGRASTEQPPNPAIAPGPGFGFLCTERTRYDFEVTQQQEVIRLLFKAWELAGRSDGALVPESTIRERVGSNAERFSVAKLFNGHPALDRILRRKGKNGWALFLNADRSPVGEAEEAAEKVQEKER